jgi:hypothetical protein
VIVYAATTADFLRSVSLAAEKMNWINGKLWISHVAWTDGAEIPFTPEELYRMVKFLNGSFLHRWEMDPANPRWQSLLSHWPGFNVSDVNPFLPPAQTDIQLPQDYFLHRQQLNPATTRGWGLAYDTVITIGLASCGGLPTLRENLAGVNFAGTSGNIRFLPNFDRDPSTFKYYLYNIFATSNSTIGANVVGSFSSAAWNFTSTITYSDGGHVAPVDVAPPNQVIDYIPFGAKIVGYVEGALAVGTSTVLMLYTIHHRKHAVFVESQPMFMILLSLGCLIIGASIITLTIENDIGCMLFPWFFSIGLVLAMTSIATKSLRVAILWHRQKMIKWRSAMTSSHRLLAVMLVFLGVDVIIMACWQVIAPWHLTIAALEIDQTGAPVHSSAVCTSTDSRSSAFIGVLLAYLCAIALITGLISFWVRNVPEKFSETKYLAIAGMSIFQLLLMSLPIAFAVWSVVLPRFLILSSLTWLLCFIVLGAMFGPKWARIRSSSRSSFKPSTEVDTRFASPYTLNHISKERLATSQRKSEINTHRSSQKSEEKPVSTADRLIATADKQSPKHPRSDRERPMVRGSVVLPAISPRPVADWRAMVQGIKTTNGEKVQSFVQTNAGSTVADDGFASTDNPPLDVQVPEEQISRI